MSENKCTFFSDILWSGWNWGSPSVCVETPATQPFLGTEYTDVQMFCTTQSIYKGIYSFQSGPMQKYWGQICSATWDPTFEMRKKTPETSSNHQIFLLWKRPYFAHFLLQNNILIGNFLENILLLLVLLKQIPLSSVVWLWFTLQNKLQCPQNRHFFLSWKNVGDVAPKNGVLKSVLASEYYEGHLTYSQDVFAFYVLADNDTA